MTLNANTIRELLDASMPGPWKWWGNDLVGSAGAGVLEFRVDCGAFCQGGMVTHDYTSKLEYDQKLIELAPELAADCLRLREENARLLLSRDKHARDSLRIIKYFRDHHPEAYAQFAENLHAILEGEETTNDHH